jgi:hypothetical protein
VRTAAYCMRAMWTVYYTRTAISVGVGFVDKLRAAHIGHLVLLQE